MNYGDWHYVVAVFDDPNDKIVWYIDDVKVENAFSTSLASVAGSLYFGRAQYAGSDSGFTKGLIDEIAIWNAALTDAEAHQLYQVYIPEPATVTLMAAAVLFLPCRRRRTS